MCLPITTSFVPCHIEHQQIDSQLKGVIFLLFSLCRRSQRKAHSFGGGMGCGGSWGHGSENISQGKNCVVIIGSSEKCMSSANFAKLSYRFFFHAHFQFYPPIFASPMVQGNAIRKRFAIHCLLLCLSHYFVSYLCNPHVAFLVMPRHVNTIKSSKRSFQQSLPSPKVPGRAVKILL